MDGIKVMDVALAGDNDDMADGMQCNEHPFRNNPGGICAFCLQDKLGKLVSSSFPMRGASDSSSSATSPSFRSDFSAAAAAAGSGGITNLQHTRPVGLSSGDGDGGFSVRPTSIKSGNCHEYSYNTGTSRIPFMLAANKKKSTYSSDRTAVNVFKRSKSTTTPRSTNTTHRQHKFLDDFSPRKRGGFWSFLYHSSSSSSTTKRLADINNNNNKITSASAYLSKRSVVIEEDGSPIPPPAGSFDRKVSRSRSVGCGSRSFSGDFFERISTGFGDCTLRRVESQRESNSKPKSSSIKERVKCGGIFGGFTINSSSNSSSSSSSYWVSSSEENNKSTAALHGRTKSWGWAFASPMRAFGGGANGKIGKRVIVRENSSIKNNTTPNLANIPSLLAVRS